jgi:toxin ParE1/3/4
MAPMTEEPGVRELTVLRYPYKVYYAIENDEVWILHVRHSSRRPPDVGML